MQWFLNAIEWLKGKKVYFLSVSAILAAVGAYLGAEITLIQMVQAIWAAILAMGLRAGITKSKST